MVASAGKNSISWTASAKSLADNNLQHPKNPYQGGNRTFGRRLGRPLKAGRQAALEKLPLFDIPPELVTRDGTLPAAKLFPEFTPQKIWFEIGFGQGEHLLARMKQSPADAFIGAEPYINGMSSLLANLPEPTPKNIRLYMDDALFVMGTLADSTLDGIYVLNPDPWFKKKHHKRRIITPENLDMFARTLKPGGLLIMSTDVAELAEWMRGVAENHPSFEWVPENRANPQQPPAGWPVTTKYMAWGVSEGRKPHFYLFRRR